MTIRLNGATSGFTEIDAPSVAGSNTLVLPEGNGSADQVLATNGSGTLSFVDRGRMVLETAKTATGTSVDFTGIPSWVKKITVMFNGVSTNGTSVIEIRLGTSGGIEATGYSGNVFVTQNTVVDNANISTGFMVDATITASDVRSGALVLNLLGSSAWIGTGSFGCHSTARRIGSVAGSKTLSGTLDRIRITTVNGTDTFDAGSINILMEG